MKAKKSHRFTLLEVVIAIALLGIMLSALFSCFQQTLKKNITARELKQKVLQIELLDSRLNQLFSRVDKGQNNAFWLQEHKSAKNDALFVSYSQTADRNPLFLGPLQGVLYLDSKGHLTVETQGKKDAKRVEILLDNVQSLRWELFDSQQGKWCTQWPKKKARAPAMIKLTVEWKHSNSSGRNKKTKKDPGTPPLVYFISSPGEPILFEEVM